MTIPDTRLFHLHYHVPDVEYAERVLADEGLPLHAKFGSVDDEIIAVEAGEEPPAGFQFRLQDSQRGYANITLTSGKDVQFDHLGLVTASFDSIIQRATDAGWTVQGVDDPRTFLITPWGFRIEVHPEDGRVVDSLGSWEECRFEDVVLTVPESEQVKAGISEVIGHIQGLNIREERGQPHVPRATMNGQACSDELTIRAASLAAE